MGLDGLDEGGGEGAEAAGEGGHVATAGLHAEPVLAEQVGRLLTRVHHLHAGLSVLVTARHPAMGTHHDDDRKIYTAPHLPL